MPEPSGKPVMIIAFVNADHTGTVVMRRSSTRILIFVQNALIMDNSKRQNMMESGTFTLALAVMRIAHDRILRL